MTGWLPALSHYLMLMLTDHWGGLVAFTWRQFRREWSWYLSLIWISKPLICCKNPRLLRANWVINCDLDVHIRSYNITSYVLGFMFTPIRSKPIFPKEEADNRSVALLFLCFHRHYYGHFSNIVCILPGIGGSLQQLAVMHHTHTLRYTKSMNHRYSWLPRQMPLQLFTSILLY